MKKLYLVLCMVLCMVAFTACGNSKQTTQKKIDISESDLKKAFETVVPQLEGDEFKEITNDSTYDSYVAQYGEDLAASVKTFVETTKDFGKYKSIEDEKVSYAEDSATVEAKVAFEKGNLIMRMTFSKDGQIASFSCEELKTLGQKMIKAALNTLMGMGTVFVVLIFISLVISLLGFIPKWTNRKAVKEEPQVEAKVVEEIPAAMEEEEELVSDSELVAVITAAIMASMGDEAPADGLVVRSIRKANSKWKNA